MKGGKFARNKGVRLQREVAKLVGAEVTGHAYLHAPDLTDRENKRVYSVKASASGFTIAKEIESLEKMTPDFSHFMLFRAGRGKRNWFIAQRLEQWKKQQGLK